MPGFSPKLPLSYNSVDGYYTMTKTPQEAIRQNFWVLLTTNPGERTMDPNYGVGLDRYLFENRHSGVRTSLTTEIQYQLSTYLPQVSLTDLTILSSEDDPNIPDNSMFVDISYVITSLGLRDSIRLDRTNMLA